MKMCWLYASMRIAQNVNDSRKKSIIHGGFSLDCHREKCSNTLFYLHNINAAPQVFFLDAASLVMQCQKLDKRPLVLLIFVHFTLLGKMV